ncbi:hypothetical protein FS749_009162, partial [Ceratobasidium sp. UAMH 11750]
SWSRQGNENTDDKEEIDNKGKELDKEEIDNSEELDKEDTAPEGGEYNYAANAHVHGATPCLEHWPHHNMSVPTTASSSLHSAPSPGSNTTLSSLALPTQSSNCNNCCADKVVTVEKTLAKAGNL